MDSAQTVLQRDELLELVLARSSPHFLASVAALVCRQWRALVLHSERVWRGHLDAALLELHRALRQAPARTTSSSASKSTSAAPPAPSRADLSLLQLHVACHTRNLLRNPAFSRAVNVAAAPLAARRRPWVVRDSGSPVAFQNPPLGVRPESEHSCFPPPPLPYPSSLARRGGADGRPLDTALRALQRLVAPEQPGCLATAKDWCEVVQVVDLQGELEARGLLPAQAQAVLNSGVAMGFSLMVAAHHSHSATFAVGLMLDDGRGPMPSTQSFVKRSSSYFFYSHKKYISAGSGWLRFAHVVPSCPPGCRRAVVLLRGRASGGSGNAHLPGVFLDAHSVERGDAPLGTKFASATLQLLPQHQVAGFMENSMSAMWRRPQEATQSNEDLSLPATEHPPLHETQAAAAAAAAAAPSVVPVVAH